MTENTMLNLLLIIAKPCVVLGAVIWVGKQCMDKDIAENKVKELLKELGNEKIENKNLRDK